MTVFLLAAAILCGCSGARFMFTGTPDHQTIELNASDGDYAESDDFSVGKDRTTVISADLSSGSLQIEFAEAAVIMTDPDSPEDVIIGNTVKTVTVSGKEEKTVDLPEGSYAMRVTASGTVKGKIEIGFVKK